MTDALRSDRSSAGRDLPDRERDARIEALLLSGLDHYFAGRHELAISVWSRVLFLDRGHSKARAYIDRARSALAERHREGEELFHTGAAALHRGDTAAARQLLTSAVEQGASGDDALILLHRLDRLDAVRAAAPTPPRPAEERPRDAPAGPRADQRVIWMITGILAGVLIAAVAGAYIWIVADPLGIAGSRQAVPAAADDPVPVPTAGEIRLLRARDLVARGHFREALTVLEQGSSDERIRVDMDELRAAIQRRLLDDVRAARASGGGTTSSTPRPATR